MVQGKKKKKNLTVNVIAGRYHGREPDFQRFGSYDSWSGWYNRWVYPSVMHGMLSSCVLINLHSSVIYVCGACDTQTA